MDEIKKLRNKFINKNSIIMTIIIFIAFNINNLILYEKISAGSLQIQYIDYWLIFLVIIVIFVLLPLFGPLDQNPQPTEGGGSVSGDPAIEIPGENEIWGKPSNSILERMVTGQLNIHEQDIPLLSRYLGFKNILKYTSDTGEEYHYSDILRRLFQPRVVDEAAREVQMGEQDAAQGKNVGEIGINPVTPPSEISEIHAAEAAAAGPPPGSPVARIAANPPRRQARPAAAAAAAPPHTGNALRATIRQSLAATRVLGTEAAAQAEQQGSRATPPRQKIEVFSGPFERSLNYYVNKLFNDKLKQYIYSKNIQVTGPVAAAATTGAAAATTGGAAAEPERAANQLIVDINNNIYTIIGLAILTLLSYLFWSLAYKSRIKLYNVKVTNTNLIINTVTFLIVIFLLFKIIFKMIVSYKIFDNIDIPGNIYYDNIISIFFDSKLIFIILFVYYIINSYIIQTNIKNKKKDQENNIL